VVDGKELDAIQLIPLGTVRSSLLRRDQAPRQPDEGAPEAFIDIEPEFAEALAGLRVGQKLLVITWLDRADRGALSVHPRGDRRIAKHGVFATRSPDRPNPLGLHSVVILEIAGASLRVDALEALDGTPVVDLKPELESLEERRSN
jgi:tRNA-Thr(GGU) m(6)t(6)A37 methyltransferase TsaA